MRRLLYLSVGILELCAAGVLLALVWELPGPADLRYTFGRAERVGQESGAQIRHLREQLKTFGERQPRMQKLAGQLQKQLKQVGNYLGNQQMDFKAIEAVRDALGDVADGLSGLSGALDPKTATRLGQALGTTATYLEDKVAPAAARAAEQLETSTEALRVEAEKLATIFRSISLESEALKGNIPRLERLEDGLGWLARQTTADNLQEWQRTIGEVDRKVTGLADQVALLSSQKYPSVTFNGFIPTVVEKPIWPEGKATADRLRSSGQFLSAANRFLESLGPVAGPVRQVLKQARQGVFQTRQLLMARVNQPEELGPLLKSLPEDAARLAEALPKLGQGVARLLRDTDRLKEVALVLRQAQKGIESMVESWPDLQQKLGRTVVVLRVTRKQLDYAIDHREEYEASLRGVSVVAETLGSSLPVFTSQLEHDLAEQERSLRGLEVSIGDATAVIPQCEVHARKIVGLTRLLLAMLAVIISLHGVYLGGLAMVKKPYYGRTGPGANSR
jgi:hypothetical protein